MITEDIKDVLTDLKDSILTNNPNANVGKTDRIISVGTGTFILFKGITNLFSHPLLALTEVGVGAALLHRGVTGSCEIKKMIDGPDEADEAAVSRAYPYPASSVSQL